MIAEPKSYQTAAPAAPMFLIFLSVLFSHNRLVKYYI